MFRSSINDVASPFQARLAEAANFFGVQNINEEDPDNEVFLPTLTFLTEPNPDARVPASVDLTSFGVR